VYLLHTRVRESVSIVHTRVCLQQIHQGADFERCSGIMRAVQVLLGTNSQKSVNTYMYMYMYVAGTTKKRILQWRIYTHTHTHTHTHTDLCACMHVYIESTGHGLKHPKHHGS
jgi:hypothetical protein